MEMCVNLTGLFFIVVMAAMVYLNIAVTYCALLCTKFSLEEKLAALVICWLMPIFGFAVMINVMQKHLPMIEKKGWFVFNRLFLFWVPAYFASA